MACVTDMPVSVVQCPSCAKPYQDPRLLPCFHTLCLHCLTQKLHTHHFPCPTCHTQIFPPPEGAAAFPVDALMEKQLLQTEDIVTVLCDVCQKDDITRKCIQCQQLMCDACSHIHARLTVTRSHTLLTFDSLGGQKADLLVKERCCKVHPGEKLRFFCKDCRSAICRDCKLTTHQPHSAQDVSSVSGRMLKSMQTVAAQCHNQLQPKLEQVVEEAEQSKEAFTTTVANLLQEARNRASEIKNCVDKHMENVEKQASENSSNQEDMMSMMKSTLASVERMTQRLSPDQDTGYPPDVINLFLNVQKFFNVQVPCSSSGFASQTASCADVAGPSSSDLDKGTLHTYDESVDVLKADEKSEGRFEVFTQELWKKTLQLSSSAAARPHGFLPPSSMAVPEVQASGSSDAPFRDAIERHIGMIQIAPQAINSIQDVPRTIETSFGAATAKGAGFNFSASPATKSRAAKKTSLNSGFQSQVPVRPNLRGKIQLSQDIQQELVQIQNHLMIEGDMAVTTGHM